MYRSCYYSQYVYVISNYMKFCQSLTVYVCVWELEQVWLSAIMVSCIEVSCTNIINEKMREAKIS